MNAEVLGKIGLTEADRRVYFSLLRVGKATVTEIAKDSGVHRTNIYNILDKLGEMGLVSQHSEENRLYFKATDPSNLVNYTRETLESINSLVPNLKKIQETAREKVEVEVFHGEKGMKAAYRDMVRVKKEVFGFGMAKQLRDSFPIFSEQWIRDMKKAKINSRFIYVEGAEFKDKYFEARTLTTEFFGRAAEGFDERTSRCSWSLLLLGVGHCGARGRGVEEISFV
ncbi:MAG: helix-turn-helix domain-containing protein [archaeon]